MNIKYLIGIVIIAIVALFGFMYQHNQNKHEELQKQQEENALQEKRNQEELERLKQQREVEEQQRQLELDRQKVQQKDIKPELNGNNKQETKDIESKHKLTEQDLQTICKSMEELAGTIMEKRQEGTAMSVLMDSTLGAIDNSPGNIKIKEAAKHLIIAAYDIPQFPYGEARAKEVKEFKDQAYLICISPSPNH